MAELSLKQIVDRLNEEFAGDSRRIVFWYDDNGDFVDEIEQVQLNNAKILVLDGHNQFAAKLIIEREDVESNYLIYAPYPEPALVNNHLADVAFYSKRFYADRISLIVHDLGIDRELLPMMQKYSKLFGSKERTQRFYALQTDKYNAESLSIAMLCVCARVKVVSFEEVLRVVLTEDSLQDNSYLQEFAKYELESVFWELCQREFGYVDETPNLTKLAATLLMTYASCKISKSLPVQWKHFVMDKTGSVMTFLDGMMNSILYRDGYDNLVGTVEQGLHVAEWLSEYEPTVLYDCDIFRCVDTFLLKYITQKLLAEDLFIKIGDYDLPSLCDARERMHFGEEVKAAYDMLKEAYQIISGAKYVEPKTLSEAVKQYIESDYKMDSAYRHFYRNYDALESVEPYETLRELVENIYTNEYLGRQLPSWNDALTEQGNFGDLPRQTHFYHDYLQYKKEKTVVIISDAFRYEAARELYEKLADDEKNTVNINLMIGVLPSYTRLGMLALLPHQDLELNDSFEELIDGQHVIDMKGRQAVLQKVNKNNACISFEELKKLKKDERRQVFTGRQVVYVYHDRVDSAGENSPDSVFAACDTAITEIFDMVKLLSNTANIQHFIITADHGFIYKRDAVTESEKIAGVSDKDSLVKRRYIVGNNAVKDNGICHLTMGSIFENNDKKIVSFPMSHNVFKAPGGGLNYVHGGSSPQELIVPVVEVYAQKGHVDTQNAEIKVVTMLHKITNLITNMEFVQSAPVSDMVKAVNYALYFEDESGAKITNVENYAAESREQDTAKRIFKVRFVFKNQTYDATKKYYMVIMNQDTNIELSRQEMRIDVAFAGDFGF